MKEKQNLITFDLDQTLVKTKKAHALAFQQAFKKQGFQIKLKSIEKFIDGRHGYEVIKALKPRLKKNIIEKINQDYHKFFKKTVKFAKPIKGALKVLKSLKKNYKIALVTNCSKEEVKLLLKKAKIPSNVFNFIVFVNKHLKPKPWPDLIFKTEKLAHINSDIHVGDSIYDVLAAKKAKAVPISVLTGTSKKEELKKKGAYCVIKDITFLPKCLSKCFKNAH